MQCTMCVFKWRNLLEKCATLQCYLYLESSEAFLSLKGAPLIATLKDQIVNIFNNFWFGKRTQSSTVKPQCRVSPYKKVWLPQRRPNLARLTGDDCAKFWFHANFLVGASKIQKIFRAFPNSRRCLGNKICCKNVGRNTNLRSI